MTTAFRTQEGLMVLMPMPNIDTDLIIPQTELITESKKGLGEGLFARLRYLRDRVPDAAFVLNRAPAGKVRFLLAGHNFGCGSSREHAAWALFDYGIRAIVSTGFGDIFYRNCINNAIVPALISTVDHAQLEQQLAGAGDMLATRIDLRARLISVGERRVAFAISDANQHRLLNGFDEIEETLASQPDIDRFVAHERERRRWVFSPLAGESKDIDTTRESF
jgi:3-isopropylmalate/(R)-2-methylmalate dehydratase small subunit